MKKFFVIVTFLFIAMAIALFVFALTFDANQYKPFFIEKIEEAIKKDVEIDSISLDILPPLALKINGVSIKDTDKTWDDAFLNASSIEAAIRLIPLIKKDIQIEHLYITGLSIVFSKSSMGLGLNAMNYSKDNRAVISPVKAPLRFLVKSVSVKDSSIGYLSDAPGRRADLRMDIIEATLKNISLYGPIDLDAKLSAFGRGSENIGFTGVLYPEFKKKDPYVKNLKLTIDLARFSLKDALNALGKTDIAQQLAGKEIVGDLVITSERMYLRPKKLYDLDLRAALTKGMTDMPPLKDGLKDVELGLEMRKGDITIQKLTGRIAGGFFSVNGIIKEVSSDQHLDLDMVFKGINVGTLLPDTGPGKPSFEGIINIDAHSLASGLEKQKILETLKVRGSIKLEEAEIKNMNILRTALEKLYMLPGLVEELKRKLPQHYKELLKQDYTSFRPVETDFNINDRRLFFDEVLIESDAFYLAGNGYLGLDERNLSASSDLFIPEDLSGAFIEVVQELRFLQDNRGLITMPLDIGGKLPDITVKPDLDYVIQKLAISKGQELLEGIFGKEGPLGTKDRSEKDHGGEEQEAESGTEERPGQLKPEEAIIKTIFDIITLPREKQ